MLAKRKHGTQAVAERRTARVSRFAATRGTRLGAMAFRLNDKHLVKPPGQVRRGKRTIAKEKLYKHILGRIRQLYPNFNIGESTGMQGDRANRWRTPIGTGN